MEANKGLVRFMVNRMRSLCCTTFDEDDMEQEANIALLKTIRAHQASKGKLSTIAVVAMRRRIDFCARMMQAGIKGRPGGGAGLDVLSQSEAERREPDLVEGIPDDSMTPEEQLARQSDTDTNLRVAFGCLSPCERSVLERRFGLGCARETLQQVADRLHLSKETIRKIQIQALMKARAKLEQTLA